MKTFLIIAALLTVLVLYFFISNRLQAKKEHKRGWRTKSRGRDAIFYEEKFKGGWKSIEIDGEMLVGKINKVLYFKTEEEWKGYPDWAQHRSEIITRIKQDWPPTRTDYENDTTHG